MCIHFVYYIMFELFLSVLINTGFNALILRIHCAAAIFKFAYCKTKE